MAKLSKRSPNVVIALVCVEGSAAFVGGGSEVVKVSQGQVLLVDPQDGEIVEVLPEDVVRTKFSVA